MPRSDRLLHLGTPRSRYSPRCCPRLGPGDRLSRRRSIDVVGIQHRGRCRASPFSNRLRPAMKTATDRCAGRRGVVLHGDSGFAYADASASRRRPRRQRTIVHAVSGALISRSAPAEAPDAVACGLVVQTNVDSKSTSARMPVTWQGRHAKSHHRFASWWCSFCFRFSVIRRPSPAPAGRAPRPRGGRGAFRVRQGALYPTAAQVG